MNSADGADEHPEHVPQAAFDVLAGGQLLTVAFDRRYAVHKGRGGHGDRDGDAGFADHRGDPGVGRGAEVHEDAVGDGLLAGVGVDDGAEQVF